MDLLPVRYTRVSVTALTSRAARGASRVDLSGGRSSNAVLAAVDFSRWVDCILVRPAAAGRYEIIDGEARVAAAKAAGAQEIDAAIVEVSDQHATLLAVLANLVFRREGSLTTAKACLAALDALPSPQANTQVQLARAVGRSQAWISSQLRVARALSDDMLAAAALLPTDLDEVPFATLRVLSRSGLAERSEALQRARAAKSAGQSVAKALRAVKAGKQKKRSFQAQYRADGRLSVRTNLHQLSAADAKQLLDTLTPPLRMLMERAGVQSCDQPAPPAAAHGNPADIHKVIIRRMMLLWRNIRRFVAALVQARQRDGSPS